MISSFVLSRYLPHSIKFAGLGDIYTLYSISIEGAIVLKNEASTVVVAPSHVGNQYKPILISLSKLPVTDVEECEDCDCDNALSILSEYDEIFLKYNFDLEYITNMLKGSLSTNITNMLIGWHFDVFGLIERGLAIEMQAT